MQTRQCKYNILCTHFLFRIVSCSYTALKLIFCKCPFFIKWFSSYVEVVCLILGPTGMLTSCVVPSRSY